MTKSVQGTPAALFLSTVIRARRSRRVFHFGTTIMPKHLYSIPASEPSPGQVLSGLIDQLRAGDILACPDVTHLAVRWGDLKWILDSLETRASRLEVQHTSRKAGESAEAGFRRDLKRAAVHRAIGRGAYKNCGRKRSVDPEQIRRMRGEGRKPRDIAAELRIGIASVYRALAAA
jgi:hypothetical protein